jgi:hypothetical protein
VSLWELLQPVDTALVMIGTYMMFVVQVCPSSVCPSAVHRPTIFYNLHYLLQMQFYNIHFLPFDLNQSHYSMQVIFFIILLIYTSDIYQHYYLFYTAYNRYLFFFLYILLYSSYNCYLYIRLTIVISIFYYTDGTNILYST